MTLLRYVWYNSVLRGWRHTSSSIAYCTVFQSPSMWFVPLCVLWVMVPLKLNVCKISLQPMNAFGKASSVQSYSNSSVLGTYFLHWLQIKLWFIIISIVTSKCSTTFLSIAPHPWTACFCLRSECFSTFPPGALCHRAAVLSGETPMFARFAALIFGVNRIARHAGVPWGFDGHDHRSLDDDRL